MKVLVFNGIEKTIKGLRLKNRENWILPIFLSIHIIILLFPYKLNGYKIPVGWDTPHYILNMNIISEKGIYEFIKECNYIAFYSIFEYFISNFLNISPIILEKFLPPIMGISLTLINYLVIKQLYNSIKLEVIVLIFSIINFNIVRLVSDLHRNLFSLILVELSLFIILQKYLNTPKKMTGIILMSLLVVSGLSHLETFFVAIVTLSFLFVIELLIKSHNKNNLFIITSFSLCIVVLINLPFLPSFLSEHMTFNPQGLTLPLPKVEDYLKYLGGPLIPLYFLGLALSIEIYRKKHEELPLLLFLWNIVLLSGSLLQFLDVVIPSWRFILLTTVPIMSTIGLTILFKWKIFIKIGGKITQINNILIVSSLIILTPFVSNHYINNMQRPFRPWISNEAYNKLTFISTLNSTDSKIFVIYFDKGKYTAGFTILYYNWIKAILGSDTGVYFGKVNSLLLELPTPCKDEIANRTSYMLWEEVNSLNISESDIYLIDDWYRANMNKNLIEIYPGIYKLANEAVYVRTRNSKLCG